VLQCVGALRGLHRESPHTYDPLVIVIGKISDVAVCFFEQESH
jgi:dTDP-4-dehydrorhamnose 3,5-epimerase-like enzyme